MRLIEEHNLMKLNIVSIVFIVLTSVFIQISDHFIEERFSGVMLQVLALIQKEQFKVSHDFKARFYTIYRAMGITAHNIEDNIDSDIKLDNYESLNIHQERIDLRRQFKTGALSAQEYTDRLIDFHTRQSERFRADYNRIWNRIQKTKPLDWNLVKKACIVIQMIGVGSLLFGYSKLLILIQNRIYSKSKI